MMQHLKIFKVELLDNTLVVMPHGDGSSFRYNELHIESNAVRARLAKTDVRNLVIDLSDMEYFGSEFIGSLISMMRETKSRGGKSCFCSATPQMLQILKNMSLFKLWPYFDTRDEAITSLSPLAQAT